MLNFLQHVVFWQWIALGALLLILEVLTGSGFLLWIGMSAGLIGFALFLFPTLHWAAQFLGFATLGILTGAGWWLYLKRYPIRTDRPTLNRRGEQYIGRVFTLESPVINGMGKIHVDDSIWRIRCIDLPAGGRVKVIGVDGVILHAEPFIEDKLN